MGAVISTVLHVFEEEFLLNLIEMTLLEIWTLFYLVKKTWMKCTILGSAQNPNNSLFNNMEDLQELLRHLRTTFKTRHSLLKPYE